MVCIESAYELAWKLGTPPSNVSDHRERQLSACGKSRHVRFSSDVDIRFTLDTPSISATLVVAESRLHNWTEKPWRLYSSEPSAFSDCIEKAAHTSDQFYFFTGSRFPWFAKNTIEVY